MFIIKQLLYQYLGVLRNNWVSNLSHTDGSRDVVLPLAPVHIAARLSKSIDLYPGDSLVVLDLLKQRLGVGDFEVLSPSPLLVGSRGAPDESHAQHGHIEACLAHTRVCLWSTRYH